MQSSCLCLVSDAQLVTVSRRTGGGDPISEHSLPFSRGVRNRTPPVTEDLFLFTEASLLL